MLEEVYETSTLLLERREAGTLIGDFIPRDIELREVLELLPGKTLEEAMQCTLDLSDQEGSYMYTGKSKATGALVLIMGLHHDTVTGIGIPWLLSTDEFEPDIEFIRKSKWFAETNLFNDKITILSNYIHRDNTKSIKWLRWLGFQFMQHPFLDTYYQFYKHKE